MMSMLIFITGEIQSSSHRGNIAQQESLVVNTLFTKALIFDFREYGVLPMRREFLLKIVALIYPISSKNQHGHCEVMSQG